MASSLQMSISYCLITISKSSGYLILLLSISPFFALLNIQLLDLSTLGFSYCACLCQPHFFCSLYQLSSLTTRLCSAYCRLPLAFITPRKTSLLLNLVDTSWPWSLSHRGIYLDWPFSCFKALCSFDFCGTTFPHLLLLFCQLLSLVYHTMLIFLRGLSSTLSTSQSIPYFLIHS